MGQRKYASQRQAQRQVQQRQSRYLSGNVRLVDPVVNASVTRSAGVASAPETTPAAAGAGVASTLTRAVLPCEIRIVDEEKREIELCATSEAVDTFGTVFGYEASKDAFTRWIGNVREMHNRVAVGRKVSVRFDDNARKIYTRLRISKGAPDTWEKVLDGTLAGASIGASDVTWRQQRIAGQDVPYATHYDLMELSLVDYPSNPDALGVTFVRDGVPDAGLLDDVAGDVAGDVGDGTQMAGAGIADGASHGRSEERAPDAPASQPGSSPNGQGQESEREASAEPTIREGAGSLATEDPAALIAAAALTRGQNALAAGDVAASEPTDKQRRLAALGAPGYQQYSQGAAATAADATRAATAPAPGEGATGYGVGEQFDIDGDHESPDDYVTIQSGPTAGAAMLPSPAGSVAHMAHAHHHTGRYDDPSDHREVSGHQHLDGTSHTHEHVMDHDHGGHAGFPNGHSHPHGHVPAHDHYYRVADGLPIDARFVTGEQVRTSEYVSAQAFRAAQGVEGRPLSAEQFRIAAAYELRAITLRAQGAFSRNPYGSADIGTPADATPVASASLGQLPEGNGGMGELAAHDLASGGVPGGTSGTSAGLPRDGSNPLSQGTVTALDRDGQPIAAADANGAIAGEMASTGTLDVSEMPDGLADLTDGRNQGRVVAAEITRALQPQYAALAGSLADLSERLQRIEQTPQSGGPILRAADRGSAFAPGGYSAAGKPGASEQYAALESLAGKLADPQAQVAVAAEMIRMQQEAAGMPTALQVMPRAGQGWR